MPIDGDIGLVRHLLYHDDMKELLDVDLAEWRAEIPTFEAHFCHL